MKVTPIGVTGRVGRRLAAALPSRGYAVTGITPHAKLAVRRGLQILAADATKPESLETCLKGEEAVIGASRLVTSDTDALSGAMRRADATRPVVVGGAGNLEVAQGKVVTDNTNSPEAVKAEANASALFLERLTTEPALDWNRLSPSADFAPGGTGRVRLGGDQLLGDAEGKGHILMEDFAATMDDDDQQQTQSASTAQPDTSRRQPSKGDYHGSADLHQQRSRCPDEAGQIATRS